MGEIFKYCHSYDGKEHLSRVAMLNGDLGQSLVGLAALAVAGFALLHQGLRAAALPSSNLRKLLRTMCGLFRLLEISLKTSLIFYLVLFHCCSWSSSSWIKSKTNICLTWFSSFLPPALFRLPTITICNQILCIAVTRLQKKFPAQVQWNVYFLLNSQLSH